MLYVPLNKVLSIIDLSTHRTVHKISKKANQPSIQNQVPSLAKTPHGNVTKTQDNITYERAKRLALSQQVTTRLKWTNKKAWQTRNINYNKKDPQKKHRLGMVSKNIFTGGLKLVLWYQPRPYFWCGSRQRDVWFAWKISNLSMDHFPVNTNQGDKVKIRTQTVYNWTPQ